MARFSLRLPDGVHAEARRLAERDGMSLNDWLAAAVDREVVRRRLESHNVWVSQNQLYAEDQWLAEQQDIAEAAPVARPKRRDRRGRGAA